MIDLFEIEASTDEFLLASDVAPFLGVNAQDIRSQAQADPTKLGFPVIVTGSRIRIPRMGFLHFIKYGYAKGNV
jgi:hypothetical protein